jgi:type II secretory pathway pseudopilin PulG
MPTSPAMTRNNRPGFALLELLVSLLLLTVAILAIGTSSYHLLKLERDLLADAGTWRVARSALALHRAGRPEAEVDAHLSASGWNRTSPETDPQLGRAGAGWKLWVLESGSTPPRSFRVAVFELPRPPPKPTKPGVPPPV